MRRSLIFRKYHESESEIEEVKVGPMDLDTFMIITEMVVKSDNPESTGLQWVWE